MKDGLDIARRYHAFGFNVIPTGEEKRAIGKWGRWQTEPQADAHLQRFGFHRSEVVGMAGVSGIVSNNLVAIDMDEAPSKTTADSALARLGLPRDYEWLVHTPGKGGGWHVWILVPELGNALEAAGLGDSGKYVAPFPGTDHIELRWNNHYTLLPPSGHPEGGQYQFEHCDWPSNPPLKVAPNVVLRLAKWKAGKVKHDEPAPQTVGPGEYGKYVQAAIDSEVRELSATPQGDRNNKLYAGAFKLGAMAHAGADRNVCGAALVGAACSAGLPEHESIATFESGWNAGMECPKAMPERKVPAVEAPPPQEEEKPKPQLVGVTLKDALKFVVKHTEVPLPDGIPYPWEKVNTSARAMRPGWLCYLAGYTSHGKTAAAIESAVHAAKLGNRVLFISGEMSPDEIAVRFAQRWGMSSRNFYQGTSTRDDKMAAQNAAHDPAAERVSIVYTRDIGQIERACEQYEPEFVVVDYLQFLDIGRSTRIEGTTKNSQALKHIARTYKVPVLALSQLRRANRENREAAPELDDLRDSGSIEQDGDHVIFVWRQSIDKDQWGRPRHTGNFIIRKARMGELGKVPYVFDPIMQTFET